MFPLISIVVPVYNVEKYLDRCINSIINQTYKNLEIILVDDGSPDRCGCICDVWAKKDDRIKVIHKTNGGVSDARNIGVESATGRYLTFVDSDDYVSTEYILYLYNLLIEHDADISCCKYMETSTDVFFKNNGIDNITNFNNIEACNGYYGNFYYVFCVLWGKLYKTEIVKNFKFPIGRVHEDEAILYKYYYTSNKIVLGDCKLYAYFQNDNSITHNRTDKNIEDIMFAFEEQTVYFSEKNNSDLEKIALERYVGFLIHHATNGVKACKIKLKSFSLSKILFSKIRIAYKLNFIGWIIFRQDLYAIYCKLRRKYIR